MLPFTNMYSRIALGISKVQRYTYESTTMRRYSHLTQDEYEVYVTGKAKRSNSLNAAYNNKVTLLRPQRAGLLNLLSRR